MIFQDSVISFQYHLENFNYDFLILMYYHLVYQSKDLKTIIFIQTLCLVDHFYQNFTMHQYFSLLHFLLQMMYVFKGFFYQNSCFNFQHDLYLFHYIMMKKIISNYCLVLLLIKLSI